MYIVPGAPCLANMLWLKNRDQSGKGLLNPEKKGQQETTQDRELGGGTFQSGLLLCPLSHICTAEEAGQEGRTLWSNSNWGFYLGSVPRVIFKSLLLLIKLPIGATIISSSPFSMNPLGLELQMTRIPYEEPLPLANSLFHTGKALSPGMKNT